MKTFYAVVANSLAASLTNTFVWFAVTFWVYLETTSVVATSIMAGTYLATVTISGVFLGSLVDRYPKKTAMLVSSTGSLVCYALASIVYLATPPQMFTHASSVMLWVFISLALLGAILGNLRSIALATLVTLLIPEPARDRANGLVGTANGVAFLGASICSGLAVGLLGIVWVLGCALILTTLTMAHLWTLTIVEQGIVHGDTHRDHLDIRGTIQVIRLVPGLFGLIFFHTFNNFLGGVFMSLMDAYGLLLVSVEVWGGLWGLLSLGFIVGGLVVARKGLGPSPLRTLFLTNIAMWIIASIFTIQASIVLLTVGLFIYLCLIPVTEAAEQTMLQTMIPPERQGRVFGFAQSIEQSAAPLTAVVIGPITELFFMPFMTTGRGVDLLGSWFGTGPDRGIALVFTVTGLIGLAVTLMAMRSYTYRTLSQRYQRPSLALVFGEG